MLRVDVLSDIMAAAKLATGIEYAIDAWYSLWTIGEEYRSVSDSYVYADYALSSAYADGDALNRAWRLGDRSWYVRASRQYLSQVTRF